MTGSLSSPQGALHKVSTVAWSTLQTLNSAQTHTHRQTHGQGTPHALPPCPSGHRDTVCGAGERPGSAVVGRLNMGPHTPQDTFPEGLTGFVGRQVGVTKGQVRWRCFPCVERLRFCRGELIIMFASYINPPQYGEPLFLSAEPVTSNCTHVC